MKFNISKRICKKYKRQISEPVRDGSEGGSERRWNPLEFPGCPGEPPVDFVQKTFLTCLFVKLKVSKMYSMHITYNLYYVYFPMTQWPSEPPKSLWGFLQGVPNSSQGVSDKNFSALRAPLENLSPCQFLVITPWSQQSQLNLFIKRIGWTFIVFMITYNFTYQKY